MFIGYYSVWHFFRGQVFKKGIKMRLVFLYIVLVFMSTSTRAQGINLAAYEWQNRIVLVVTDDGNSPKYLQQLQEFENDNEGFSERKLLVFDIQKDKYRKISYSGATKNVGNWRFYDILFEMFARKDIPFSVILIGLDGGIKRVYKNEVLPKETLFAVIDGMFLRQQELERD